MEPKAKAVAVIFSSEGIPVLNAESLTRSGIKMIDKGLLFTEVGREYETRFKRAFNIGNGQRLVLFLNTKRNSHGQRVGAKFTVIYSDKFPRIGIRRDIMDFEKCSSQYQLWMA